ncbi:MAG: site-2 protease family protein [Candidatus Brocadiia bacterium]|nr:MAG: site-2 protease family protein [Candidatus Brocadiia bacterium]
MEAIDIALAAIWYGVFIISTTFHEASHAFAASKLGDPTAHSHGLATFDPVPHIRRSPFGMVIIPLLSFFLNGWMVGWASVPYDPYWARYNRKKAALMSLAGPCANLTLIIIAAGAIRLGIVLGYFHSPDRTDFTRITEAFEPGLANSLAVLLSISFSLNLVLLTFNLIPLPPLDGTGILALLMNDETVERYEAFLSQPGISMFGLFIAWQIFGQFFGSIMTFAMNILYPGQHYGAV